MTEYECEKWQSLIIQSLEDIKHESIDKSAEIRKQILQHPFNCEHPICKQVAMHMTEIMNGQ